MRMKELAEKKKKAAMPKQTAETANLIAQAIIHQK